MTRFYYDDPLAAAWMCQEFGMTFEDEKGVRYGSSSMVLAGYARPRPQKHIIHRESLPLLAPRLGDVIYSPADGSYMVGGRVIKTVALAEENISWGDRVIHRDGKVFHWPLQEPTPQQKDTV